MALRNLHLITSPSPRWCHRRATRDHHNGQLQVDGGHQRLPGANLFLHLLTDRILARAAAVASTKEMRRPG